MSNRRISETIGIRYADVSQMGDIVGDIRSMLENHEDIDTDQTLIVNFVAFNASSLDIMVYTFTKTTKWVEFHEVKQDVLLQISNIIEGYGAEVAFPTRTLHLPEGVRLANGKAGKNDDSNESDESASEEASNRKSKTASNQSGQSTRYGDADAEGEGE